MSFSTLTGLAVLLWAEAIHWRASRRGFPLGAPPHIPRGSSGTIVVLGIANRGQDANAVNRWRARMALRSVPVGTTTTIITSGGAVRGPIPEATLLARHLRTELGWHGPLHEEPASRSTWENIRNVTPWLEDAAWIMLVSNSVHAEKARAYLRRQRPDLADRLVPARDHRFGEMTLFKPVLAVVGLIKLRSLR
ncbi:MULTISPECIES: YdcF family protein [unclassified Curtobacterium]|uniref:YdcF family protein n=1 Tax=unclassified Curtobacterium TaxID=257496 RepID=UPI00226B6C94|nr:MULTISPECIES: YdcF family protein [unclassified Curtobacterium]